MPKPRNPKEIKHFLGLCSYYRKFVPHFADILRSLAKLTGHNIKWNWCTKCDLSFQMMKDFLISAPILKYPDTSKPYTVFTDASKYGWAGVPHPGAYICSRWERSDCKSSCILC